MRIIFIGDIVGSIGVNILLDCLFNIKKKYYPDIIIANAENSTEYGKGINKEIYDKLILNGIDVITLGNHCWDNNEIFKFIDNAKKIIRPINFYENSPGKGYLFLKIKKLYVAIINLQAMTFMNNIDNPFIKINKIIKKILNKTNIIFVDFHGESTSEKKAMGWFLDGKVSAVIGTHTHVQTNDFEILPKGTAYLTDVGMTGACNSILGMDKDIVINKFLTLFPYKNKVVNFGKAKISSCLIDINELNGKAIKIKLLNIDNSFLF